jgi:hypothetical protein
VTSTSPTIHRKTTRRECRQEAIDIELLGRDAAQLLAFALKRASPSDRDYKDLITRYGREVNFRDLVNGMADGLGLVIIDPGPNARNTGLAVCCSDRNSPFAPTIDTYQLRFRQDYRPAIPLVHLGVMSYYFPNLEADDEYSARPGSPEQVMQHLRAIAVEMQAADRQDDAVPSTLRKAYQLVLEIPEVGENDADGRKGRNTLLGMVRAVMDQLVEMNYLRISTEGKETIYQPRQIYHLYVRRYAGGTMAQLLERIDASAGPREKPR